jgi:hypothetical protein
MHPLKYLCYCNRNSSCVADLSCYAFVLDFFAMVLLSFSSFQCLSDRFPCRTQSTGSAPVRWSNPHFILLILVLI